MLHVATTRFKGLIYHITQQKARFQDWNIKSVDVISTLSKRKAAKDDEIN
jgi:hypothetical protein